MLLFIACHILTNLEMFSMKQYERRNIYTIKIHLAINALPYILAGILGVICFVNTFSFSFKAAAPLALVYSLIMCCS